MIKDYSIKMQDKTNRVVELWINGDCIGDALAAGMSRAAAFESVEGNAFQNAIARGDIDADAWLIVGRDEVDLTEFNALKRDAVRIKSPYLRDAVEQLIESGRVNANDTWLLDKAIVGRGWAGCFHWSVAGLLTERGVDKKVIAWFAKRGIIG